MKTAIYIEDGIYQLVITPESEFEKSALKSFQEKPLDAKMFSGSFYDCRGGWIRQTAFFNPQGSFHTEREDKSLIIRVNEQYGSESN